jgi:hypothetical protein
MFPWVREPYLYEDQDRLLAAITEKAIGPAEANVIQMARQSVRGCRQRRKPISNLQGRLGVAACSLLCEH